MSRASIVRARWETVRRAFAEFLTLPSLLIAGFLGLAAIFNVLERADLAWLRPTRTLLQSHVFGDPRSTADLLGTIAGSLITVTSITISLLLVALQQTAGSLSSEVFDQFLRRRHNQFYFGFFVGLALYALITLASVNEPFNPVLGASLTLLLTVVALFMLIVLLYTTINQMRPAEIIEAVHDLTLHARERQRELLAGTRRTSVSPHPVRAVARAARHGYVTFADVQAMGRAARHASAGAEVILDVSLGTFVATGDSLARVRSEDTEQAGMLARAVEEDIRLERQRDIATDPANGIEEILTIAWTSISTSKSNPAPGLQAIRSLRDLLARWADEERGARGDAASEGSLPVVYHDTVIMRVLDALESLAVVSTESMQHQAFTEVARALAALFDRLPEPQQARASDVVLRMVTGLGDHVLTAELENALRELARALEAGQQPAAARAVAEGVDGLRRTVGSLNSRATRVVR